MALTISGMADMLAASGRIGDGKDAFALRNAKPREAYEKEEKDGPYASILARAAEGGEDFRKDIGAIVREIEKIDSGESEDREELRRLLDLTASKSRNGAYGASPPTGVFFPALFA